MPRDSAEAMMDFSGRLRERAAGGGGGGGGALSPPEAAIRFNTSTLYIEVSNDGGTTWVPQIPCYAFYV